MKLEIFNTGGYSFEKGNNRTLAGITPYCFSPKEVTRESIILVESYEGVEAYKKYWQLDYKTLSQEKKDLIESVLTLDFNKILKTPDTLYKIAVGRVFKEGLGKTCSRCGGTGHYSYNPIDRTRCFKCAGNKFILPKLTDKYLKQLKQHFKPDYPEKHLTIKIENETDSIYKYHASPRGGFFVQEYPYNPNGIGRLIGDVLYYGKPSDCMWISDQLNKKIISKEIVLDDKKIVPILKGREKMLEESNLDDLDEKTIKEILKKAEEKDKENYKWKLAKKSIVKDYETCTPSIKNITPEGAYKLFKLREDKNIGNIKSWADLKEIINNNPEYKELRDELINCKIKEQKIINQNKDLEMGVKI